MTFLLGQECFLALHIGAGQIAADGVVHFSLHLGSNEEGQEKQTGGLVFGVFQHARGVAAAGRPMLGI